MPKQTFDLTVEASVLLQQYKEKMQVQESKLTLNQIVSEAIKFYCMMEQRDRAEEMFEKLMENRFRKFENRLAAMIAAVGIDVDMILVETLESREALLENRERDPKDIYTELRKEGLELFRGHRAFRLSDI